MLYKIVLKIAFWWAASIKIPAIYGAAPRTDDPPLKCIVMSHGLGGSRFLYSNICCELASRGFVVAALEHKDHSACHTFFYANKDEAKMNKKSIKEFRHIKFGKDHYPRRNEQLRTRSDECGKVIDFFINLNKGFIPHNVMDDVPFHRNSPTDFSLNQLVGKLDIGNICIMGHSFGAATALYTLSRRPKLKCGILLDPWMFPVKGERLEEKINQPMLFINTQTFHIAANVEAMSKLIKIPNREMYTIKHTTHENQTDSVLLVGYWLNWFMRKLNPLLALKINNSLILRFLSQNVNPLVDISDCTALLEQERHNVEMGLTKPWA
ncbi:platelet-activating factor acetylhydrolase-like [Euwallacea similis]|uniref:platelet-activating factor acetylhydrolase-like n=1 Tax=Euwallacea similis TaxID=1736056 RepID=UPI00344F7542